MRIPRKKASTRVRTQKPSSRKTDGRIRTSASLVILIVQGVALLAIALVIGYALFGILRDELRREPSTATAVLEASTLPPQYSYETQFIRRYKYEGDSVDQSGIYAFSLDTERRSYGGVLAGWVFEQPIILMTDGDITLRLRRGLDSGWNQIETIPMSAVLPPSTKQIAAADSVLISNEGTLRNRRAWVINFTPTRDMIKQLMLVNTLGIEGIDEELLESATIEPIRPAEAWVDYQSRSLQIIDIAVRVGDELEYRILVKYLPYSEVETPSDPGGEG